MKKSIVTVLLFSGLIFVSITACSTQNNSTVENAKSTVAPVVTPGEIYENEALSIGIMFPPEYKDKYNVQPNGNISFTVNQKSTGRILFEVRRFITLNPADGFSGDVQEDLLLQAGNSVYIVVRQPANSGNTDNLNDREYTELTSDALLDEIISSSYTLESDNPIISSGASPVYSALARMSVPDGGMQEDFVYTLSDGCINPALNVPLLFINGSFTAKGTGLLSDGKIEPGNPYIPAKLIAEEFGGTANWNPDNQSMTVKVKGHEFLFTVGSVIAFFDGKEVELTAVPILDNDCVYVAGDDDFYKYFSLEVGYMPDFEFPPFAGNPIITIDEIGTTNKTDATTAQGLKDYVIEQLLVGLENMKKSNIGGRFEKEIEQKALEIQSDIENITIYGTVSQYLLMRGPYLILIDVHTKDMYFYQEGHGLCGVYHVDINDPNLFLAEYIAG